MSKKLDEVIVKNQRKKAGELIKCVLVKRMPVKNALLAYPKDSHDESVIVSWHALCHLEADESLREDHDYAVEQDMYLDDMANTLLAGEEIPDYIREPYKQYYKAPLNPHKKGFEGFLESFRTFLSVDK